MITTKIWAICRKMSKIKTAGLATLTLLLLSGCMVGPDYKKPNTNVDAKWNTNNSASIKTTQTKDAAQNATWWKSFNDPVLNHLIEVGYKNNLTLQSTGAKVLQARAQLAQSVGELYPQQQGISSNYSYNKPGANSTYANVLPSSYDAVSANVQASWELDFWGMYRRAIQANDANFLASLAAYDNALVSLTAEIGSSYIAIRTYQAEISVTKQLIAAQKASLHLTQAQYEDGKVDQSAVEQSQTTLSQTEANLPTLEISLQQEKDALAVLLGTTPNKIDPLLGKGKSKIPVAPKSVAMGIPNDVLRQRPDVHQAELQAIAQSESIGAVKAQLYPALSLNGSFGYSSTNIGNSSTTDLFQWSNHTVSIGPSLSLPLFNYGQITNQVRAQDAVFQQAIFNYQNVVLTAQKEVQDGIVSYTESQKSLQSMNIANNSALKTAQLTEARYQAGETDYSSVLNAQIQQLNVQLSLVNAEGSVPQGLITLYRALGGGWQIRGKNDVVSDATKKEMKERTNWGSLLDEENHLAPTDKTEKTEQTWLPNW